MGPSLFLVLLLIASSILPQAILEQSRAEVLEDTGNSIILDASVVPGPRIAGSTIRVMIHSLDNGIPVTMDSTVASLAGTIPEFMTLVEEGSGIHHFDHLVTSQEEVAGSITFNVHVSRNSEIEDLVLQVETGFRPIVMVDTPLSPGAVVVPGSAIPVIARFLDWGSPINSTDVRIELEQLSTSLNIDSGMTGSMHVFDVQAPAQIGQFTLNVTGNCSGVEVSSTIVLHSSGLLDWIEVRQGLGLDVLVTDASGFPVPGVALAGEIMTSSGSNLNVTGISDGSGIIEIRVPGSGSLGEVVQLEGVLTSGADERPIEWIDLTQSAGQPASGSLVVVPTSLPDAILAGVPLTITLKVLVDRLPLDTGRIDHACFGLAMDGQRLLVHSGSGDTSSAGIHSITLTPSTNLTGLEFILEHPMTAAPDQDVTDTSGLIFIRAGVQIAPRTFPGSSMNNTIGLVLHGNVTCGTIQEATVVSPPDTVFSWLEVIQSSLLTPGAGRSILFPVSHDQSNFTIPSSMVAPDETCLVRVHCLLDDGTEAWDEFVIPVGIEPVPMIATLDIPQVVVSGVDDAIVVVLSMNGGTVTGAVLNVTCPGIILGPVIENPAGVYSIQFTAPSVFQNTTCNLSIHAIAPGRLPLDTSATIFIVPSSLALDNRTVLTVVAGSTQVEVGNTTIITVTYTYVNGTPVDSASITPVHTAHPGLLSQPSNLSPGVFEFIFTTFETDNPQDALIEVLAMAPGAETASGNVTIRVMPSMEPVASLTLISHGQLALGNNTLVLNLSHDGSGISDAIFLVSFGGTALNVSLVTSGVGVDTGNYTVSIDVPVSTSPGNATLRVTAGVSGFQTAVWESMVELVLVTGPQDNNLTLTVISERTPVDPGESVNITATVTVDAGPVGSVIVTFSSSNGTIDPVQVSTGADGKCTVTFIPAARKDQGNVLIEVTAVRGGYNSGSATFNLIVRASPVDQPIEEEESPGFTVMIAVLSFSLVAVLICAQTRMRKN